jgi:hypothetical protein
LSAWPAFTEWPASIGRASISQTGPVARTIPGKAEWTKAPWLTASPFRAELQIAGFGKRLPEFVIVKSHQSHFLLPGGQLRIASLKLGAE